MILWTRRDLVRLIVGVGAGGIIVALAWNGAATESALHNQKGFIALGVVGFLVAVAAQTLWLRRGRKAVAAYAATVQSSIAGIVVPGTPGGKPEVGPLLLAAEALVATTGMRHFHRPDCPIAAGQDWSAQSRRQHEAEGRTPCGICLAAASTNVGGEP